MRFGRAVEARRRVWSILADAISLEHQVDDLLEECEDDFDVRRMKEAIRSVRASCLRNAGATPTGGSDGTK